MATAVRVTHDDLEGPGRVLLVDRWRLVPSVALMASAARALVAASTMVAIVIRVVSGTFMVAETTGGHRIANVLHRSLMMIVTLGVPLLRGRTTRFQGRPLDAMIQSCWQTLHEYSRLILLFGLFRGTSPFFKVIKFIEVFGVELAEGSVRKRSAVLLVIGYLE